MRLVTEQDETYLRWANTMLDAKFRPDLCRWIAGLGEGMPHPIFVLVYSRITERSCELTIASDFTKRWCTRRALRLIFSVPTQQWRLRRLTAIAARGNRASVKLLDGLGFQPEGIVRSAFANEVDGLLYGMLLPEEAEKWLR